MSGPMEYTVVSPKGLEPDVSELVTSATRTEYVAEDIVDSKTMVGLVLVDAVSELLRTKDRECTLDLSFTSPSLQMLMVACRVLGALPFFMEIV